MSKIIPVFKITDSERSKSFYIDGLGFTLDWEWQQQGIFMQISCDGISLYLSDFDDIAAHALCYWYVENVDQYYQMLLQKSIAVDALPENKAWRNREMQISDPDNNILRICTPTHDLAEKADRLNKLLDQ